jgi:hypothetical protein
VKTECGAERRGRVGPCPKAAHYVYGGQRLCKQHFDAAHWVACDAKRESIDAVALRLAALMDASWYDDHGSTLALPAVAAATQERARLRRLPAEEWHGGRLP